MCGIGGIIKYGNVPISEEQIAMILMGNERRGVDATGIALSQDDGSIDVWKTDKPAWQAVTGQDYYQFIREKLKDNTWAAILHTRAATQGNPRDNNNNHPMFAGQCAIVHNGGIQNEKALFKELGVEPNAETDSDVIRGIIDKFGFTKESAEFLRKICGTVASAAIHPKFPKQMFIMRSGSPLTFASTDDFLLFSSEKNTLHTALRPSIKRFGMYWQPNKVDAGFCPMPDDTLWHFNHEGHQAHYEFPTFMGTYVEPKRKTYDGYEDRQAAWTRQAGWKAKSKEDAKYGDFKSAWCRHCEVEWVIPKTGYPHMFSCDKENGGCGEPLIYMPKDKQ
jgi:asparagine synthetase B (glutamine-hydrolysing)